MTGVLKAHKHVFAVVERITSFFISYYFYFYSYDDLELTVLFDYLFRQHF